MGDGMWPLALVGNSKEDIRAGQRGIIGFT